MARVKNGQRCTENFRKNINKMLDTYRKEFNLPFIIRLRVQTKARKFTDWKVERHGIMFDSNLSIDAVLQYFSDEALEKIIRYCVYGIACEYENQWSEITCMGTCTYLIPDDTIKSIDLYNVPEEKKYVVPLKDSEIQKIKSEYRLAREKICNEMINQPILGV